MDPTRFESVQSLFHEVVDLPRANRPATLAERCAGDTELFEAVTTLLAEDDRGRSLIDEGLAATAHRVLSDDAVTIRTIGPYQVLRTLGEGGMGVVWLAQRTDLGTTAAIKILRDGWISPARRDRFIAEQRTLAQLDHPSIARLLDAGTLADGTPWIVMEYVDGVPITDYACRHHLPIADRLRLVRTVAEAVQHAHRHVTVHRDLKPSNVLVTADGTVKLLDFGIAKQLDTLGAADRTRTALRMLTPAYAAPEQIRGEGVGLHTDVYGLGALLYELLTGQAPFDLSNSTPTAAEAMILEENPRRPSAIAKAAGHPLEAVRVGRAAWSDLDVLCLVAMHKEPVRRYASADAFIRDIDHYLRGEPLEARPDALGYRAAKFIRRHRIPVGAAAGVILGIVALTAFYTVRLTRARDAALTEGARAQRMQTLMSNLLTGGEDATVPAESLRVVDMLDRGVLEAQNLVNDAVVQADLFQTLGSLYQSLGRFATADDLLARALDGRRSLFGHDSAEVARNLVAVGLLRLEQGQFDEAERAVREGLDMSRRHLAPTDPQVSKALTALGQVLEERGGYAEAAATLEEAVRLQSVAGTGSADLASSLRHLGNVHFYAGKLDQAEAIFQRTIAMTRQVNGDRHALVADDLINLGAVQFERGRYQDAEKFYREALPISEGWFGKDHHQTASNLTMLGRTLAKENRHEEALAVLKRAVSIQERVFGPVHPRVASAVNEIGTVALQRARYDEAEAAFARVADIYRAVYPGKHYLTGIAISNLGSVYMARKEFARAEPLFREAIALYSETQSPEHLNVGIARIKLGRVLLGQERYGEAESEALKGYEIVSRQASASVSWLKSAREDLITIYTALGQNDKASRLRAASTNAASAPTTP